MEEIFDRPTSHIIYHYPKNTMKQIIFLLILIPLMLRGQSDSLKCGYDHSFGWSQTIAPAALVATGSIITASPWLHTQLDKSIHDWSQRDNHPRFEAENVIQYTPIASILILKACGVKSKHGWRDLINLGVGSGLLSFAISHGMKYTTRVERPYEGVFNSFPSGHTTTAFMGAEMLRREYGEDYPGIAIAGYTVATGVGLLRIYNNRHWVSDVVAGAGIGILSASIMYWLAPYLRF